VVTEFLNDRVPASVLESARLVVSELVTDSLHHSGVSDTVVIVGVESRLRWSGSRSRTRAAPA
jgi:hypothetical protein